MDSHPEVTIRPGDTGDAAGVAAVLNAVIAERRYTSLDGHWSVEAERAYIAALGPTSVLLVAEVGGEIAGFQTLEPFDTYTPATDHVGTMGTLISKAWRGRGIGRRLATATLARAREMGYEKIVIYIRVSNQGALAFYRSLGFHPRGILRRQVKIDGEYEDQLFLELFLTEDAET
jgi:RimJ/RimL family protein N-acetyltransferase